MQRRKFLKNAVITGSAVWMARSLQAANLQITGGVGAGKRVGIIGLDSSHSVAFTQMLNAAGSDTRYNGYKVTAAYPYGSRAIESSFQRIAGYTAQVKSMGVTVCDSLDGLLEQVDCVLLETNDGRLHPDQASQVFESRKPVFIDKPLGADLKQVEAVFTSAEKFGSTFFTSSALRYTNAITALRSNGLEKIKGVSTFSPCTVEKSHEDLYWYGIHGVEMLIALMGAGCATVQAAHTENTDFATGIWEDGRVGTFRGMRDGFNTFGGTAFTQAGIIPLDDFQGYEGLLQAITGYFASGKVPVPLQETKEIYAFMSAFQQSRKKGGKPVKLHRF
ncbi:MAG TPA: Gfo/Idh/MocA family oxidoreductase [Chitinophagaceae bacterium]|jgi:predicted dehydrogenase|nr:Gfo/Idh/MocA family oxidoreductase [Chitinophagaceae bacterium]